MFANPRPTRDEIVRYYSREGKYDTWLADRNGRDRMWHRRLRMIRHLKSSGELLDVGTGIGQFLALASAHYQVTGTEVSESACALAHDEYGLDIMKGPIEHLDFGTRRFDLITITHVLEHVHDPNTVIDHCVRLLKPDGVLVIAVPNELHAYLRRMLNSVLVRLGSRTVPRLGAYGLPKVTLDGTLPEIHLLHFSAATMRRWLEGKGLGVVREDLDPCFVDAGWSRWVHRGYYHFMRGVHRVTGRNFHDALYIAVTRA
ncbi:MAG: class I SAM-dependent methyltransferase [Gemmatimonadota bacterium]